MSAPYHSMWEAWPLPTPTDAQIAFLLAFLRHRDEAWAVCLRHRIAEEREACAKAVEEFQWPDSHDFASHAAAAIRARG